MLTTPRLVLRQWRDGDLPAFIEMNKNTEVMRYFPCLYTRKETEQQYRTIAEEIDRYGYGLFAAECRETGRFLGFIGLHHTKLLGTGGLVEDGEEIIEIAWRLIPESWNRGLATEGAAACLDYGLNTLGLGSIYSFTARINTPSIRVMQKIGMEYRGVFAHSGVPKDSPLREHVLYTAYRAVT